MLLQFFNFNNQNAHEKFKLKYTSGVSTLIFNIPFISQPINYT